MGNLYREIPLDQKNPLTVLKLCNGYYECPRGKDGNRNGPLVGYAGHYRDKDGLDKQYVGDVYYNIAKAEEYPHVIDHFGYLLRHQIAECGLRFQVTATVAAPMGGIILGHALGRILECRTLYAEKRITKLARENERERFLLLMGRHELGHNDKVVLVEDVCNNFSTVKKLRDIVHSAHGTVAAIACAVNRSEFTHWNGIPVVSVIHQPTVQYRQDDPRVQHDIERVGLVQKPKESWERLMAVMMSHGGIA